MIDTHCHLDFDDYEDNLDDIVFNADKNNIQKIINPGSSVERSKKAFLNSQKYENVYFACGSHPEEIKVNLKTENLKFKNKKEYTNLNEIIEEIEKVFPDLLLDKKCVAIGEIGLDYNYLKRHEFSSLVDIEINDLKKAEQDLFIYQLEIAKKYNKPVIIHNRDSKDDIYNILKEYNLRGVVHCFSEDKEYAKRILDLGFYISFTGNITFKNVKDYILESVKYIPKERLLCETDGPFLAPQEFRGELNKPEYVKYVYNKICELKNLNFDEFEKQVDENVKELFGIEI